MDKVLNKITNIFKSRYCSRKNYWIFFGILTSLILILVGLGFLFEHFYEYGFYRDRYWFFLGCLYLTLNIIMQIKRLRDANITPYIILLRIIIAVFNAFTFNNWYFYIVLDLIYFVLLLLPSQRIPTTNLVKEEK